MGAREVREDTSSADASGVIFAKELTEVDRREVMDFLEERPVQTALIAGQIEDNGLVNPRNRGTFFGYRDPNNVLTGVALIGRNTFLEARTDDAITALALAARNAGDIRMVFGPERDLAKFWPAFADCRELPQVSHHDLLMATRRGDHVGDRIPDVRLAKLGDLDAVVAAHAEMVLAATGIDPMEADPEGFVDRCRQRVENNRVWVWIKGRELIFKVDVIGRTSKAIYIEGLWVNPKERGAGLGTMGLVTVCHRLLTEGNVVCAFAERLTRDPRRSIYTRAGFQHTGAYAKICV